MKNVELKKAKIVKDEHLELEFKEVCTDIESGEVKTNDVKKFCREPFHPDLKKAFAKLRPHLAYLCQYIGEKTARNAIDSGKDTEALEKFTVHGVSFSMNEDITGVSLIGKKEIAYSRILVLNAPHVKFEDESCPYEFASELENAVGEVITEVHEYLEGKHATSNQMVMDFNDGDD